MTLATIPEIMAGVADGSLTPDEGAALVGEHMKAAADLDVFAGLAMQALMADQKFMQQAQNKGGEVRDRVAEAAYAQATAMKTARP